MISRSYGLHLPSAVLGLQRENESGLVIRGQPHLGHMDTIRPGYSAKVVRRPSNRRQPNIHSAADILACRFRLKGATGIQFDGRDLTACIGYREGCRTLR